MNKMIRLPTLEECRIKAETDPHAMNPLEILIFEWQPKSMNEYINNFVDGEIAGGSEHLWRQQLSDAIQYAIEFGEER